MSLFEDQIYDMFAAFLIEDNTKFLLYCCIRPSNQKEIVSIHLADEYIMPKTKNKIIFKSRSLSKQDIKVFLSDLVKENLFN